MVSKRKRALEEFDPNKSDSGDENFDPSRDRPQKSSKKARPSRSSRSGRKKGTRYRGSDIDDDEDQELSDSQDDSFGDDDESQEDENAPVNAESSEDDEGENEDMEQGKRGKGRVRGRVEAEPVAESEQEELTKRRLVRSTRASTAETDDFVELSNSGRHAVPSRDSRSKSPEALIRTRRSSRAMKGIKAAPEPIEPIQEATQESSVPPAHDAEQPDELSRDNEPSEAKLGSDEVMQDAAAPEIETETAAKEEAAAKEEVAGSGGDDDDDDDDDVPITRRTRASRASLLAPEGGESDGVAETTGRRLTRGSRIKKSTQEPSSDFEPGDDSDDAEMSKSETGKAQEDDDDTPTPRDEDHEFDLDELNEEARELRQSSRPRRRPRRESPIVYQEHTRRSRAKVNYYMPPLTAVNIEEEEAEDPAPTPSRNRRGRGGGGGGWDRNLNTTFGPFGGGGGSLLAGPWGTVAAGGADSDSSDDEMVHRSSVAGNVGMTPTSAAPGGFLGTGHGGLTAETVGATPNVGKIKDRKALADADPLGVDMNVDFSKVGGLQGHIDQLKEMVQLPLLYPELFTKFHVTPPRGVLFHGPPGTGKTLLARALANSVGSGGRKISFYMRKGADALSKWVGEAEKQLRLLFEEARKTQPSIIFFDEIDGLAPVRSSKQEQIHASIVSTLLALMDGMDGRGQVIVIGATNRPDNIDPALRRPGRFDREFYFPLPDIEGRRAILDIQTKDWGLPDTFKASLAEKTKGYGGADIRALCTEAALNSIQRTYPQIYSSREKLVVDPDKIAVHASDFMMSIKRLIPSSERSATSGAQPLPKSVEPLLRAQFNEAKRALDDLLPRKKKLTALEEAMYEQFDDDDYGFGRETMHQEFERSRIFRPRFLIYGVAGMGQSYIASAVLHHFEGVHVQNFDLPSLLADGRPMEQVIVGLFTEVRRHKPSVIYIPNIDAWYATLTGTVALTTFQTMLKSIVPTDPVLVLATAECDKAGIPIDLARDFFGFSRKNRMEIPRPERANRMEYFEATLAYVKKKPAEFPDPENRKKRVLEELPVAPPIAPKPPTKAERKALQKRDHQLLNALKIQLQPIMDQINRRYKKFRQPVIPQAQIDYLFAESDPNYVRPDIPGSEVRPFEIVKDKHGNDVLRDTATGKCYYNLETTTIEERLSNGFYARPKDFLFDIKALARDAKNAGDKERTLKANELLSNVEVDVAGIENSTAHMEWEGLYQRQLQRAKEAAEKERKRKAMQSITDRFQSEQAGGNESDSQGPLTLGERVPGSLTTARFQLRSPPTNGHGEREQGQEHQRQQTMSNGDATSFETPKVADVRMSGVDEDAEAAPSSSVMGPPPKADGDQPVSKSQAGMTQISQKSAVTPLPHGVSPSAVINEAASTKTSDPSTHRSSNWSTQLTNGNHGEHRGGGNDSDADIPDTLRIQTQTTSSDEAWPHSQAQGMARHGAASRALRAGSQASSQSQARHDVGASMGPQASQELQEDLHSMRNSGSSASQPLSVEGAVASFLTEVTDGTSGCTIEQLQQINRELMDEIWRRRHEWNRIKVLGHVTQVFNDTIGEIEVSQGMGPLSQ
ncbi:ATPase family associated with various cellular activities (AAA) domain-containing protein [Hirsutella rhossiliensis]|uniref:ATPase family associated with various cellular activities (AAA) domain-containing protein n=1 Tax=Hirsutella rhossiliensis TaxID=111463 RepID=A0A9P8N4N3_9HYPO|nr:ATPase family associated with various cellular activities (AAA) domain-containing protein [Hirsutella rhossiliensis]KAH0966744.1 ATPase family associated with various cellular activities (AAA) domain-containing protein [Hirsutella rhossiliensis]